MRITNPHQSEVGRTLTLEVFVFQLLRPSKSEGECVRVKIGKIILAMLTVSQESCIMMVFFLCPLVKKGTQDRQSWSWNIAQHRAIAD